eukprot:EC785329.1.p2 GENE.EC785329.1~~EC785329.1.p2  ORF type:complete len:119 (+),score=22.92 EC785329.1:39-359(+)
MAEQYPSEVLMAASQVLGSVCRAENAAFLACRGDDSSADGPIRCQPQGNAIKQCAVKAIDDCRSKCDKPFNAFAGCLRSNGDRFDLCRSQQAAFVACARGTGLLPK